MGKAKPQSRRTRFEQIPIEIARRIAEEELSRSLAGLASCAICGNPVKLEHCKIDEEGKAVHDACYLTKMSRRGLSRPAAR